MGVEPALDGKDRLRRGGFGQTLSRQLVVAPLIGVTWVWESGVGRAKFRSCRWNSTRPTLDEGMLIVDEATLIGVTVPIELIGDGHVFAGVNMPTGVDPALKDLSRD